METVKLYAEPQLRNPYLIAAWPGMGSVAVVAVKYLKNKLGAEELGVIEPYGFFDPDTVSVKSNIVQEVTFPKNKFYFLEKVGENDLIIFIGDAQPTRWGYKFANVVLDVAQKFDVKRVYTLAANPAHIHHTKKPKILSVVTSPKLLMELEEYNIKIMEDGFIGGLNGITLGVAKEKNIDGICLLGEIPIYLTGTSVPRTSKAILEVLSQIAGIDVDLSDLDEQAKQTDEEVDKLAFRLMVSQEGWAKMFLNYLEQLRQNVSVGDVDESTGDLLKDVEKFLKGEHGQGGKESN
jgi:hypothetical protein